MSDHPIPRPIEIGQKSPDDGTAARPLNGRSVCGGCVHGRRLVFRDFIHNTGIAPSGEPWRGDGAEGRDPSSREIHRANFLCLHPLLENNPESRAGSKAPMMADVASCDLLEKKPA